MSDVNTELNNLGRSITEDARKYARPNMKTGNLNRSFKYNYSYTTKDKFKLNISEMYYGKYLNAKTHYMDNAIKDNLQLGIDKIIDVMINDLFTTILYK